MKNSFLITFAAFIFLTSCGKIDNIGTCSSSEYIFESPSDLMQEYVDNEVKFFDTYEGECIQMTGEISSFDDFEDQASIVFSTDEIIIGLNRVEVQIKDSEREKIHELRIGDIIEIVGELYQDENIITIGLLIQIKDASIL